MLEKMANPTGMGLMKLRVKGQKEGPHSKMAPSNSKIHSKHRGGWDRVTEELKGISPSIKELQGTLSPLQPHRAFLDKPRIFSTR